MKTKISNLLLLIAMITLPLSVNAEEVKPSDFNEEKTVVVGEVDTTVYSVDIKWTNLSFDWKYDRDTNSFEFVQPLSCGAIQANPNTFSKLQEVISSGNIVYTDDQCSIAHDATPEVGSFEEGTVYYVKDGLFPTVQVEDYSINGRIKAKASFTPSGSYANWVTGKFYEYTRYENNKIQYYNELVDGYFTSDLITSGGYVVGYSLTGALKLDVNNEYTGEKTVEKGSTIGTVTLEISEDTN